MGSKAKDSNQISIMAPLSGKIVALEQVPGPVFSEKMELPSCQKTVRFIALSMEKLHLLRQQSMHTAFNPKMAWMYWCMLAWKR